MAARLRDDKHGILFADHTEVVAPDVVSPFAMPARFVTPVLPQLEDPSRRHQADEHTGEDLEEIEVLDQLEVALAGYASASSGARFVELAGGTA